jgi:hypothetical protein
MPLGGVYESLFLLGSGIRASPVSHPGLLIMIL